MKKESGVTIVSLIMYVAVLLMIAVIIGRITVFFYNNVMNIQEDTTYSNVQSKLNYALLSALQNENISNIQIGNFEKLDETYVFKNSEEAKEGSAIKITIEKDGEKTERIIGLVEKQLYLDKVLIGENVEDFSISETHSSVENKITYEIDVKISVGKERFVHTYTSVID